MLTRTIRLTDVLASLEHSIRALREQLDPNDNALGHSMQVIPTGSFALVVGATHAGTIVSLGSVATPPWKANQENWFRASGVDWVSVLGTGETLFIVPELHCGTPAPCPALQKQMDALQKDWSENFQLYAAGILEPSDWQKEKPVVDGKLFYFATPGTDPKRPRMLFDIDPKDTTKINRIVWLSDTDQLSSYPLQTLALPFAGNELPDAPYYYVASR